MSEEEKISRTKWTADTRKYIESDKIHHQNKIAAILKSRIKWGQAIQIRGTNYFFSGMQLNI